MSSYFPDQSSQQLSFQGATREQPSTRETETKVWTYLPWWFQHCCFAPIFNCVVLRSLLFFFQWIFKLVCPWFSFLLDLLCTTNVQSLEWDTFALHCI